MNQSYQLLVLVLIPLAGSLAVFALPEAQSKLAKQVTLVVSLGVTVYALVLLFTMNTGMPKTAADRFQYAFQVDWIKAFGVHISLGADGIAMALVGMSTLLVPAVVLASWNALDSRSGAEEATPTRRRSVKNYFALLLLLEFFMIGVFTATDVFLFYVFFEAMLVPMYFIIGSFGGPRRQYAAMKFFLYSLVGGLLMLASVIGLYVTSSSRSFSMVDLIEHPLPNDATQKWLFLGFFIAFAIKAPLVPFHTWLPDAGAEAPAGGAALLVGVLDKVGTFGFLRYCLVLFPGASKFFAPAVLVLSVIGVLYAAFLAIGQRDMKRLVAYTSVAHFGFIGLGIFAFTTQGGSGAVLYMVNHGFSTGALFIVVGLLIARGKSRNVDDYGGVAKVAPRLAGLFLLAGLSALALPGMSTFISEFLVLVGVFSRYKGYAIVATTGIILAAVYVLYLYQRTFQGAVSERVTKFRDLNAREILSVAPLIAIIVFLGVYPKPVLDVINPAVKVTLQHDIGTTDPAPSYQTAVGGQK
ncbi:NADH dehydrogenase subunit M [Jatrophihabitans endophyticus]|uniref:NADH dehydrogenase subunit M n=1 Tax=Jatrophihabitans endophyticus TaxID=1206085 RepID=A0A1M5GV37_9ACTN|nr:NADH-quinone oxidoreductase subunit M [Jatrophihabitans endophyticus]SHG07624.1 NADH dehydrogenase subunit M [Jatrophihabitans endophyticus]